MIRATTNSPAGGLTTVMAVSGAASARSTDKASGSAASSGAISRSRRDENKPTDSLNPDTVVVGETASRAATKDSMRLRRKVAAWDDDFLASLIAA